MGKMKRSGWLLIGLSLWMIFFPSVIYADSFTISGTVTNSGTGAIIAGATVHIGCIGDGVGAQAVTDHAGFYTAQVTGDGGEALIIRAYKEGVGISGINISSLASMTKNIKIPFNNNGYVYLPDYAVISSACTPTAIMNGATIDLSATVKNIGNDDSWLSSGSLDSAWYISTDPEVTTDDYQWCSADYPILSSGSSHAEYTSAAWPESAEFSQPGTYYVALIVNYSLVDGDADLANSKSPVYTVTVTAPNLTPYTPANWTEPILIGRTSQPTADATLSDMDEVYFNASYANSGNADTASNFDVTFYLDGVECGTATQSAMGPSTASGLYTLSPLGPLSVGEHTLMMYVDSSGTVSESDEEDNIYIKVFSVIKAKPEIRIEPALIEFAK